VDRGSGAVVVTARVDTPTRAFDARVNVVLTRICFHDDGVITRCDVTASPPTTINRSDRHQGGVK